MPERHPPTTTSTKSKSILISLQHSILSLNTVPSHLLVIHHHHFRYTRREIGRLLRKRGPSALEGVTNTVVSVGRRRLAELEDAKSAGQKIGRGRKHDLVYL